MAELNPRCVSGSFELDVRPRADAPVVVIGAGQSGLAAARVLHQLNVPTLVLEAGDKPGRLLAALLRQPAVVLPVRLQLDARHALPGRA